MEIRLIMSNETKSLKTENSIEAAIELFHDSTLHAIPVFDNERLTGIITPSDVYQFLSKPGHYVTCPVNWIMQTPPIWAEPHETLRSAAEKMRDSCIYTLPVMESNQLVGLLTMEHLLEFLLQKYPE